MSVSTAAKDRVCAPGTATRGTLGKSYCGRSKVPVSKSWLSVTGSDCKAARSADEGVN
ncbi:hypothetical protein [Microbacterium sp. PAMC21962]|uniref:hypothetical protein n=1 Tax=Microbacterium sp. PAMC21962 TaxID=2861280 RepID=UPI001C63596D|nr:hypothetical protein [Microbacterium sp. PAMC21962]QYF98475.1 hypothetical protein KY498_04310 [Microbacterium sp. PAMC21962]